MEDSPVKGLSHGTQGRLIVATQADLARIRSDRCQHEIGIETREKPWGSRRSPRERNGDVPAALDRVEGEAAFRRGLHECFVGEHLSTRIFRIGESHAGSAEEIVPVCVEIVAWSAFE